MKEAGGGRPRFLLLVTPTQPHDSCRSVSRRPHCAHIYTSLGRVRNTLPADRPAFRVSCVSRDSRCALPNNVTVSAVYLYGAQVKQLAVSGCAIPASPEPSGPPRLPLPTGHWGRRSARIPQEETSGRRGSACGHQAAGRAAAAGRQGCHRRGRGPVRSAVSGERLHLIGPGPVSCDRH